MMASARVIFGHGFLFQERGGVINVFVTGKSLPIVTAAFQYSIFLTGPTSPLLSCPCIDLMHDRDQAGKVADGKHQARHQENQGGISEA